jgi:hypothetical protein
MLGDEVTVFANGVEVDDEEREGAETLGVRVVEERVARLREENGRVAVALDGGDEVPCDRLFVPTEVHPSNRLAEQLGCATNADGFIEVDELGRTSVARVYAAGDACSPVHQVIVAAASGTRAALAANHDAIESFELADPVLTRTSTPAHRVLQARRATVGVRPAPRAHVEERSTHVHHDNRRTSAPGADRRLDRGRTGSRELRDRRSRDRRLRDRPEPEHLHGRDGDPARHPGSAGRDGLGQRPAVPPRGHRRNGGLAVGLTGSQR